MKLTRLTLEILQLIDCQGWFDYYRNMNDQTDDEIVSECDSCGITIAEMREQIKQAGRCIFTEKDLCLVPGCDLESDILDHIEMRLEGVSALSLPQKRAAKQILKYFGRM